MSFDVSIYRYDKEAKFEYGYYDKIRTKEICYMRNAYEVHSAFLDVKGYIEGEYSGELSRFEVLRMIPNVWENSRYHERREIFMIKQLLKAAKYNKVMIRCG